MLRFARFEWFLSAVDAPYMNSRTFEVALREAGGINSPGLIARTEWAAVRRRLPRRRRFSPAFVAAERQTMADMREAVRAFHAGQVRARRWVRRILFNCAIDGGLLEINRSTLCVTTFHTPPSLLSHLPNHVWTQITAPEEAPSPPPPPPLRHPTFAPTASDDPVDLFAVETLDPPQAPVRATGAKPIAWGAVTGGAGGSNTSAIPARINALAIDLYTAGNIGRKPAVGQRVAAVHPQTGLSHAGTILADEVDSFLVQFDRPDLGECVSV